MSDPTPRPAVVTGAEFDALVERVAALEATRAPAPEPAPTPGDPEPTPTPAPQPAPPGPFIAYTADSFFRTPLPTGDVPVAADSDTGIAFHKSGEPAPWPRIRGVGGNVWGMPYAMGTAADPMWKLVPAGGPKGLWPKLLADGFHAPTVFIDTLTGTADSPLVVIDRAQGITIWAYQARKGSTPGTIVVTNFGVFEHHSNGLDRRNPGSDSTRNERSRGVIPDSMLIRHDLLAAALDGASGGTLGHVLEMFTMASDSSKGHVSPMVGSEGGKTGYGAEGQRIRVKESWTPPPGANPVGVVIARTLQRYGAYIGDNSGSGSGFKTEQGRTFPGLTADVLQGVVTWDDFEYLVPGWGA